MKVRIAMIYEKVLKERDRLELKMIEIEKQLKELPEGKLFCVSNGKYYKWYCSDGHNQVYIPKRERKLAEKLAIKKYLLYLYKELKQEKDAIDFYLKHHKEGMKKSEKMIIDMPEYSELLLPYFQPLVEEYRQWMDASYECNTKYPEQLIHKASRNKRVRSKSEVLIDMVLTKYNIPFRYECALRIGETTVYPDFTIRHPRTGEIYYWEHFGMMDSPSYRKNVCMKLQNYISNGVIPSIQLITTYESKEKPLELDTIEKVIKEYFL